MIACIIVRKGDHTAIYPRKDIDFESVMEKLEELININSLEEGIYKVFIKDDGDLLIKKDDTQSDENFEIAKDFLEF